MRELILKNIEYIDFRVLAILFCLMLIVRGLQEQGLFEKIAKSLLNTINNNRGLYIILILICFFTSMFITNDVALITFVPFTIFTLQKCGKTKDYIRFIVGETLAANLGSMLTPIGNPQNLYLFSKFNMSLSQFLSVTFPITLISLVLLILSSLLIKPEILQIKAEPIETSISKFDFTVYLILFLLSMLVVLRILDYKIVFFITVLTIILLQKFSLFTKVDYTLLLTFIILFILVGNLSAYKPLQDFLGNIMIGREILVAFVSSQILSNVPAAVLLSNFTNQAELLLVGVSIGGLGTLIASMASLISFKAYNKTEDSHPIRYILQFTLYNLLFIIALLAFALFFYYNSK